jgi:endonuclease/exonuclease/phosphatase family metal-dependent hydrolase
VTYEDAWAAVHPDDDGWTFSPDNALVRAGQMPLERGRRIDYVLVRCVDHGPTLDVATCSRLGERPVGGVLASDHYGVVAELTLPPHRPGEWG